jgi:DNA polymerase II small subunit
VQALLEALARRGTLVAPDALARLQGEPHLADGLLDRQELPFLLTAAYLPSSTLTHEEAERAEAAEEASPPPASAPSAFSARSASRALGTPAPPPFTPDTRGALLTLEEPPTPPAPRAPRAAPGALAARPHLADAYVHESEVLADVTGNSTCEGAMSDFTKYFNDRLTKIRKMLRQRRELAGAVSIARARTGGLARIPLIGIVTEVRATKNGHRLIELEDESGTVNILAPNSQAELLGAADTVIEDEVVGVICKPPGRGELLILESIIRPEVPMTSPQRRSTRPSAVAFLSDLHFGSKTFLHDDWERFLRWINLERGDARAKALAKKVRYLVVNGDVVDGIGIFPGQEDELAIKDAYEQYATAGEQLNRIRSDVKLFVLPGNHDLVRPAEPQPALPEKYRKLFPESATHVGNPCKLSVEGVEILSYHGRSMDDWITRVAGLSYDLPILAMKEMMQRRHMVPVYGLRTPIAPEHKDYLAIDTVPDVFVTGHVHAAGLGEHRGVTLINASCWQSQTAYQKMHGFSPDPGKVPVVELDTGQARMIDFHRERPAGVDVVGRSAFGSQFREPHKLEDPGVVL